MNKAHKEIISFILEECFKYGISFHLTHKKKVVAFGEQLGCGGFFDNENKELVVATKRPLKQWLMLLLHEFNHLKQWVDNGYKLDYDDRWSEWVEGKIELSKKDIKKTFNSTRLLELDCEKRTVELLRKHPKLKIDVEKYIKDANAYLYFYTVVAKHRKWVGENKKSPYAIKEIIEIMPTSFVKDYWKLPDKYEELIVKYCL